MMTFISHQSTTKVMSMSLPDTPVHERKAELFKALGHSVRVRVLELLVEGEAPVSTLLSETGLEPSHLSQHLAVLRRTGVVQARREGNAVFYRLSTPVVAQMLAAARTYLLDSLTGTRQALSDLESTASSDTRPTG